MNPEAFDKSFTDLIRSIFNRNPAVEYVKSIYIGSQKTKRTSKLIDSIMENEYPHYWKVVQKLKVFL